jgi:nitric oxide reductase activation protein
MMRDYPGLRTLWAAFHRASAERYADGLSFTALVARLAWALHEPAYADPHHWVNKGRRLFDAACRNLHEAAHFGETASILANDLGQMRVRFDASSYEVEPAYRDDNTFLWRFDETESVNVARTESGERHFETALGAGDESNSRNPSVAELQESVTRLYPEWNYRSETLREDWVTVVEAAAPLVVPAPAGQQCNQQPLRGWHQALHPRWRQTFCTRRLKRQMEGDEFDLDALVDHVSAQRGKQEPEGRVYTRAGRERRPASVLLLLDLSASTGRHVGASALSLLDRERDAAERIASAFDDARHRIALHGFASNGRSAVRYVKLKEFGTPYTAPQRQRLHALRPAWSTRIGAALRHAGHCLAHEANASKSILLVTDGEPSDIDVFDSRYLIEDARHAVRMLAAQGIRTHCISLDGEAHAAVVSIFGHANCATLPHGNGLSATLERVLAKVAGR